MTVTEIGAPRLRKEDARLVTGNTSWTGNLTFPGMLHMAVLRSTMAHARLGTVDTAEAKASPGVIAVFTGADLADCYGSLPCAWPVTPDMVNPGHLPLTVDKVRFVGDGIAVVLARSAREAADALEKIVVDYDPLPAVVDLEDAAGDGTLLHEDAGTNKVFTWQLPGGDVDKAFAEADLVFERRYVQQRLVPVPMEPRAVVATPMGTSGEYTVYSATQIPHVLRLMLALVTSTPEHKLRVVAPDVGGGFGGKLQVTAEEVLCLVLAKKLGKPIKWVETRTENFQAHHGRGQIQDIALAVKADGRVTGMKVELLADMGAYLMLITPGVPLLGAFMFPSIYKLEGYFFSCTGVFTNKTPTDAYRGAGRPEATYAVERIMDDLAAHLGMDPLALREKNWIPHEEFPFDTVIGLTYDSGNYEAATARARELFDYDGLRAEQATRRASGDPVQLGIGISTFTEMCGLAPSRVLGSLDYGAGGWEAATVRMLPTGKVEVLSGSTAHGQGHQTAFSQIVADHLGVAFEDIEIIQGDTQVVGQGMDTYGSRSLSVGGIAILKACEKVVEKATRVAAHLLEAADADIEFEAGSFHVKGTPAKAITLGEIALATFAAHNLPDGMEPDLTGHMVFDPENFSFPHGTHLCAMEVDTETGESTIRSYVCVDDIGNVINPLIVEGQVHGGLAQGIAQALFEDARWDDDGNFVTSSIVDYYVPSAADLPDFVTDRTVTPSTSNPLGVKGVGEAGTIASTPAVVNAIVDALRPLGVDDVEMACSPQRVWRAIQAAQGGAK
jgi:carbon-monoxide dehydrogenase large subunit